MTKTLPEIVAETIGCKSTDVQVVCEGEKVKEIKTPTSPTAEQEKKILRYTDPEVWRNQVIEDLLTRLEKAATIEDVKLAATAVKDAAGLTAKAEPVATKQLP